MSAHFDYLRTYGYSQLVAIAVIATTLAEKMNRKSITIWACGIVFCLSLFVALIPIGRGEGHAPFEFSLKGIAALLLGWTLILGICTFLVRCKGKRRSH
jgi:hypothetical protein